MSEQGNAAPQEGATETTPDGQEPTGQQGQTGGEHGQEPGQNANTTDATNLEGTDAEAYLESIQDPNLKAYLKRMAKDTRESRQEAANYRTKYQTALQERDTLARQNETDAERIQREQQEAEQERERLRQENRDLKVGTALTAAVTKANAYNPDTVTALLNARVELDDDGKPTNVDDLVADLKRTDPYLFRRESADAGAGSGGTGGQAATGMNDFIRGTAKAGR